VIADEPDYLRLPSYVAGRPVFGDDRVDVRYPYTGELTGSVTNINPAHLEEAILAALKGGEPLSRYRRYEILENARRLLADRAEEFAQLIRKESGLCVKDTRYEVARAQDVLRFAAIESLRDDGEAYHGDVSPHGKRRRIFTIREPIRLVAAITPFNHPLNQVAHKVAPAIAAGAPIILKPSEKTPLTAIKFAELLYEAGLPGWMLSAVVGSIDSVVESMIRDERVALVSFTGGSAIGKRIALIAGYKKLCLELGGNDPLIVLADADMDIAVSLAVEGCFRNSGQRCTAVKRLLVHQNILGEFTDRLVDKTREFVCGDPADPRTEVGTVINESAAMLLERRVQRAVEEGARVLTGGKRQGAMYPPTVIADVPRTTEMVCDESFGPLAPILVVDNLDDAIDLANATKFGLSAGVVTTNLDAALTCVKRLHAGTVNINQVPGYRIESSPFGGIKDSGLGIKEGVIEAIRLMTTVKTFSLPW